MEPNVTGPARSADTRMSSPSIHCRRTALRRICHMRTPAAPRRNASIPATSPYSQALALSQKTCAPESAPPIDTSGNTAAATGRRCGKGHRIRAGIATEHPRTTVQRVFSRCGLRIRSIATALKTNIASASERSAASTIRAVICVILRLPWRFFPRGAPAPSGPASRCRRGPRPLPQASLRRTNRRCA